MEGASSDTGGVKPMPIAGRMVRERERLLGMSAEERKWRAQWLKDQHLAPNEPVYVAEYWKERYNPIRRFYRAPLDGLYSALKPIVGESKAIHIRFWTGKVAISAFAVLATFYYFKYNQNDWTRKGGWRVISSKPAVHQGDPEFPKIHERKVHEYAERGFTKSPI